MKPIVEETRGIKSVLIKGRRFILPSSYDQGELFSDFELLPKPDKKNVIQFDLSYSELG